jgi:exodeoxyribonuclease VIII
MDESQPIGGFYRDVMMAEYLKYDAMNAGQLEWLEVSPLHYRYRLGQPAEESPSLALGTALHAAVLEPDLFEKRFVLEPLEVAAGNAKPRATKAYKDAVADIEQGGFTVLRTDVMEKVRAMALSIAAHTQVGRLLPKARERELTMLWWGWPHGKTGKPRLCRGRADLLGEGWVADIKTTRSLRDFSPYEMTRDGYHRKAAWYIDGLSRLGREITRFYFIAVESAPPHDVGVFELEQAALVCGSVRNEQLMMTLAACERDDRWPGMFPGPVMATVTDRAFESMPEDEQVAP